LSLQCLVLELSWDRLGYFIAYHGQIGVYSSSVWFAHLHGDCYLDSLVPLGNAE
jgi:hypothetical protein